MSDSNPPDLPNEGFGFLGDLAKLFGAGGSGPWETARQLAAQTANDGKPESNVDPSDRLAIEELLRVAELQVNAFTERITGGGGPLTAEVTNRTGWAHRTLNDYQRFLTGLTDSLSRPPQNMGDIDPGNEMGQMMGAMFSMMGPTMLGLTAGSTVGTLARNALGGYSLPIPRPVDSRLLISAPAIDDLVENWSLSQEDVRLWVCLHEVASLAVIGVPHIHDELTTMLDRYVGSFRVDPNAITELIGDPMTEIDISNPASLLGLQEQFSDPNTILNLLKSPEQEALKPALAAMVAVVVGTVDYIVEQVGANLITSHSQITEAIHRQRVTASEADRFVERILGLDLDQGQYDRGESFVEGVVERAGKDGLFRLFRSTRELPTTAEVDAPGLWLARIDLPEDEA